jgi:hypothetical protein
MTNEPTTTPLTEQENFDPRFYFIFNQVQKAEASDFGQQVSMEEISKTEQICRIVMDVSEETPVFMTST